MKTLPIIIFIIMIGGLVSCNPDVFFLNEMTGDYIGIYKITGIHDAFKINDNSFSIRKHSQVSMCKYQSTRQDIKFYLNYSGGEDFNFYLRTTWKYLGTEPNITLNFSDAGIKLTDTESKSTLFNNYKLISGTIYYINITHDAKKLKFKINCADIFDIETSIPMTEYTIFETGPDTELELSGITLVETEF